MLLFKLGRKSIYMLTCNFNVYSICFSTKLMTRKYIDIISDI